MEDVLHVKIWNFKNNDFHMVIVNYSKYILLLFSKNKNK